MLLIDTNIDKIDVDAALPLLSEQRRQRVLGISNPGQRRQSVAAYLLLCRALRDNLQPPTSPTTWPPAFVYGEHGKPTLRDFPDVHFSMAHTRGAVAVVVDSKPVGIDIERSDRRVSPALIQYTMNEVEQRQIADSPDPGLTFFKLWTCKEALLKLTGQGLQGSPKQALCDVADATFTHHIHAPFIVTVARMASVQHLQD